MSKNNQINTTNEDLELLSEYTQDTSLDKLKDEITLLVNCTRLLKKETTEELAALCYDYRLDLECTPPKLIEDDTDLPIEVDPEITKTFLKIYNDKKHWMFSICKLSPKEVFILLYKKSEFLEKGKIS